MWLQAWERTYGLELLGADRLGGWSGYEETFRGLKTLTANFIPTGPACSHLGAWVRPGQCSVHSLYPGLLLLCVLSSMVLYSVLDVD